MGQNGAPDPIDAAVATAEKPTVQLRQWPPNGPVTISSTGRHAVVFLPPDATSEEVAEVAAWMLTGVIATLKAEREKGPAASRLIVPGPGGRLT